MKPISDMRLARSPRGTTSANGIAAQMNNPLSATSVWYQFMAGVKTRVFFLNLVLLVGTLIRRGMVTGLAALALGATLPDLWAQQSSSSARIDLSANARGAGYPVHFAFKLLENGKEAKAEGKTEEELRADIRKWLGEYAANPAQDCLGLDAIAAYLAKIGNDPRYQPRGAKGWIPHEWINREFEAYNARWAPVAYALDSRRDLDGTYRSQVAAFLAGQILEKKKCPSGMPADTATLVPLINELPVSCTCYVTPSIKVTTVNVGFGLEAGDSLGDYVQTLYPSTATDSDKRAEYGIILATLNPHAMQRTISFHYLLKAGMTVVVPPEAFIESALRRSAQDRYAVWAAPSGRPSAASQAQLTSVSVAALP